MALKKPIEITNVIRRMRGHSQSFLVRASDGAHYVCKFKGNPQGNRSLINECIAGHLLSSLGVATPSLAILNLTHSCHGRSELYFTHEPNVPIPTGLHLGSICPVNVDTVAIFDFIPSALYSRVANLADVGVIFAFDQWVAHTARNRQFIFARQRGSLKTSEPKRASGSFAAWTIDNGMCFGDTSWSFIPQALYSCDPFADIYTHFDLNESASRGVQLIQSLHSSEFNSATYETIPRDWFGPGDESALSVMLSELQKRRDYLGASIQHQVELVRPAKLIASGVSRWIHSLGSNSIRQPISARL